MSKFIDKLASLNSTAAVPMGFARVETGRKPASILVIAEISGRSEEEIQRLCEAGLDAGLIDSSGLTAAALTRQIKSKGNLITGLVISNGKTVVQKLDNGEFDFIVFKPDLPLKLLEGKDLEETGKVISLEMSLDAGMLRSVNNLYPGADAVLVDLTASPLTVEHMMSCRRVADFSGQPVIARTAGALSAAELIALRDAGVKCLLLDSTAGAGDVKALVEAIAALPRPSKKKTLKGSNILPSIPMGFGARKGEDEDGDDDS